MQALIWLFPGLTTKLGKISFRNPSATKRGPGRFHKSGYKKTKKSLTKS